jgi:transposase InsO family protein
MSLEVLKTPVRAPQANAHCERFIGTARRECLDWMIPLSERHLRRVLAEWGSPLQRGTTAFRVGIWSSGRIHSSGNGDRASPGAWASGLGSLTPRRPAP